MMMIVITYLVGCTMKDNLLFCPSFESWKVHSETEKEYKIDV